MTLPSALIGHTGFVGSNLLAQSHFDNTYNSTSIGDIDGKSFESVVCAGVAAVKWWANQNPEEDLQRIEGLIRRLDTIQCNRFTLISTVDVYSDCMGVDEDTPITHAGLHAYGRNRAALESYVSDRFKHALIVRLPALFGPGLKKNAIFDLLHDNRLSYIHPASSFQWYPLEHLQTDLALGWSCGLRLLNLAVEPVAMSTIAGRFFPGKHLGGDVAEPSNYDMRSKYAASFGGADGYAIPAEKMMNALGRFIQAENGK